MPKSYKIVNDEIVELIEGPYAGVSYQYGAVSFEPDYVEDRLKLSFVYEVVSDCAPTGDIKKFETYIGNILTELIVELSQEGRLIFRSTPPESDENSREDH